MTTTADHPTGTAGRRQVAVSRVPVPDLCCLWAETETTPMNIALVGTLEAAKLVDDHGQVDLALIRSSIAARLHQVPMLRSVLRRTRPGQGRAVWIDAPRFSMDEHVVLAEPKQSFTDEQDFLDWCAQETVRPLDRSRPLWRTSIVPGLPDGRLGILVVVHHVVADGLRGVAMIANLLDLTPTGSGTPPSSWEPSPPPTAVELVRDNLRARAEVVRSLQAARLRRRLADLRGLRSEIPNRAPATVLTGGIRHERQLVVVREPLETLRTAAHDLGCTINDLLLAAVTQGLRDMLCPRGDGDDPMALRATVPVGEVNGHNGGMIAVTLPVGTADPTERLRLIAAETSRRKKSPHEGVAGIVSMPASLAHLGVLWAKHTAATHINLYVTNVPGPPFPLYLAGAQLHDVVPLAPLVAGVRLSVTALSYNGVLSVALLADEALTDFPALAAGVQSALQTYGSPAGVRSHLEGGRVPPASQQKPGG
jgi:diacylglycerol O-acyltransferase / wax synthase